MNKDVEIYVLSCVLCQLNKEAVPYFNSQYHPLKMVPEMLGEIQCMDIAYFPRSAEGFVAALVIVDLFSRLVEAHPLRDMTASEIVRVITNYCCQHGFPNTIYTDQAGSFKKAMSSDCFHLLEINHATSVPWRHCSNMSERYVKMIKDGLKLMMPPGKFGWWARYIKFVTYALNTSYCRSIEMTPFEAYYSRRPLNRPTVGDLQINNKYEIQSDEWLHTLREAIRDTSVLMKGKYLDARNADNKKRDGTVEKGDLVVIKRRAFDPSLAEKLQTRREGPLAVVDIRGSELDLAFLDGEKRTRHISEVAPFHVCPDYLDPELEIDEDIQTEDNRETITIPREIPRVIYGDMSDWIDGNHLLIVGIDSISSDTDSPTIKGLKDKVICFDPYSEQARQNPEPGQTRLAKTPRPLSEVFWTEGKTRNSPKVTICCMVTRGFQGSVRSIHAQKLPKEYTDILNKDEEKDRLEYFSQALTKVTSQLTEEENYRPKSGLILIEGELLVDETSHSTDVTPDEGRVKRLEEFVWISKTLGLRTTLIWNKRRVVDPKGDVSKELPFFPGE